jgi:filamentous hemagglutinin family protein
MNNITQQNRRNTVTFTFRKMAAALASVMPMLSAVTAHAQPTLLVASGEKQQPSISATAKGIPVINIVAPNSAGVSLNKFTAYNVGTTGLILNNSKAAVQTQLGGKISGNTQLGNMPAKVIVNQVTGATASFLNGRTEIAGQSAHLIVANPNGITANGAGFINVNRATLTTGNPVFNAAGAVAAIDTTKGIITIEGIDARSVDQVDLIARSLKINAALQAKKLTIAAGATNYNLGTGVVTKNTSIGLKGDGPTPTVAIDVSQLGSIHADSIRLIGSESGVGVNVAGKIAALTGDLVISSDGKVTLAQGSTITAAKSVSLNASVINRGMVNGDKTTINGNLNNLDSSSSVNGTSLVTVNGSVTNQGKVSGDKTTINGNLNNLGTSSTINGTSLVTVNGSVTNQGKISGGKTTINGNLNNLGSSSSVNGTSLVTVNGNVTDQGKISGGKTTINGNLKSQGSSSVVNDTSLVAANGSVTNQGKVSNPKVSISDNQVNPGFIGDIANNSAGNSSPTVNSVNGDTGAFTFTYAYKPASGPTITDSSNGFLNFTGNSNFFPTFNAGNSNFTFNLTGSM